MLCDSVKSLSDVKLARYIAEQKFDGERILISKKGNVVKVTNRRGAEKSDVYPEIVEELSKLNFDFWLDGEMCSSNGIFNDLQRRALLRDSNEIANRRESIPLIYNVFDVLELNSERLVFKPLLERKKILADNFSNLEKIKVAEWFDKEEEIKALWEKVQQNNLEGIVLKIKDSVYVFKRSSSWLKCKNFKEVTIKFTSGEINNAGIKLTDGFNEVQVQQKSRADWIVKKLATDGFVEVVVQYLDKGESGKLRFPSCREVVGCPCGRVVEDG